MDDAMTSGALAAGVRWVSALLTGSIGLSVCVLGIAALGIIMLMGHVPLRRGGAAVIGCFIILSAGTIGEGLASHPRETVAPPLVETAQAPSAAAQQSYDPYAFASLHQ